MFDGSTTGRAFESPLALYIFGIIGVVSVALWFWGRHQIRTYEDQPRSDEEDDD